MWKDAVWYYPGILLEGLRFELSRDWNTNTSQRHYRLSQSARYHQCRMLRFYLIEHIGKCQTSVGVIHVK
jgi:hypothetical protein